MGVFTVVECLHNLAPNDVSSVTVKQSHLKHTLTVMIRNRRQKIQMKNNKPTKNNRQKHKYLSVKVRKNVLPEIQ